MQIKAGQRWVWEKSILVEVMEDSREFDPEKEHIEVKAKRLNGSSYSNSWSFGKYYWKQWVYLEGQDRPQD